MKEEPSVLILQQARNIFRGIVVSGRKTPLTIVSDFRAEQFAVLRGQDGGIGLVETWYGYAEEGEEKADQNQQYYFEFFMFFEKLHWRTITSTS